jgi:hypothetical protein
MSTNSLCFHSLYGVRQHKGTKTNLTNKEVEKLLQCTKTILDEYFSHNFNQDSKKLIELNNYVYIVDQAHTNHSTSVTFFVPLDIALNLHSYIVQHCPTYQYYILNDFDRSNVIRYKIFGKKVSHEISSYEDSDDLGDLDDSDQNINQNKGSVYCVDNFMNHLIHNPKKRCVSNFPYTDECAICDDGYILPTYLEPYHELFFGKDNNLVQMCIEEIGQLDQIGQLCQIDNNQRHIDLYSVLLGYFKDMPD